MDNIRTKTAKMLDIQDCFQNHIKSAKTTQFFYSQAFTLPKDSSAKSFLSTTSCLKGNSTQKIS